LPLRRLLAIIAAAVCLLAVRTGVGRTQTTAPRRSRRPAVSLAPPSAIAAGLLRNARPFLRSAATLPPADRAFPTEETVELYHVRYEQVMPNGLSGLVEQRVFQVRNASAARLFALDDVWYDKARNLFRLISARVVRPDRHAPNGWRLVGLGRDGGDLHPGGTGNEPRRIVLPPLRAGDRVSVVYELLPDNRHDWSMLGGRFIGNLFAFRDSFATVKVRYVLTAPKPIATAQVGLAKPRVRRIGGNRWQWSWSARELPAFFSSPDGPSITDRSPFVQVSGFDTWAAMATWYNNLLAQRARLTPVEEQRLLAIAGHPAADPDPAQTSAIVSRVWAYLSGHLDYRGDESGIHAYVPAPVGDVLNREAGDCKDGALVLATWLRAAGVDADLALVRTPDLGQVAPASATGAAPATIAAFDHALVYVPATRQWIDTTAPDHLDSELPPSDQNSLALIVRSGQERLVRVPAAPASANLSARDIQLRPVGGGWLQANGTIEVHGAQAPAMRDRYGDAGLRRKLLSDWLHEYFPGAVVSTVDVSGVRPPTDTVRIEFAAQIPPQSRRADWLQGEYTGTLAGERARTQALELPYRWQSDTEWSLQLGVGQTCAGWREPAPYARSDRFGAISITARCSRGWYQVRTAVTQAAWRIEPNEYTAFRRFWQSVDEVLDAPALTQWRVPSLPLLAAPAALR
jgi:hypothetical protein